MLPLFFLFSFEIFPYIYLFLYFQSYAGVRAWASFAHSQIVMGVGEKQRIQGYNSKGIEQSKLANYCVKLQNNPVF